MKVGDYVLIIKPPSYWEGAGEYDEDLIKYVGHVGRIIEVTDIDGPMMVVKFVPSIFCVGQRYVEKDSLLLVSSPARQLPIVV
jgi:hypothetical protein